jgi:VWFA-related protein
VFISPTLGCVTQVQAMPEAQGPVTATALTTRTGRVVNTPTPDTTASRCFNTLRDSVSAATQANVSIYSFDPTVTENPGWASPSIDGRGGPGVAVQRQQASDGNPTSVFDGARVLASETGGFSVFNVNNFNKALDRIVRDHSLYYLIGYYPTNDKADGKLRKNAIALTRNDVQVLYRPAYTAPKN